MKYIICLIGILCLFMTGATERAWGAQALSDEELDRITAGTLSVNAANGIFDFSLGQDGGGNLSMTGNGTLTVGDATIPTNPSGYLVIRDNAQSYLHAFVNVNAVNSVVQLLLNLTVNINSTIGSIQQLNTVQQPL